jgi:hypothetical protein
MSGRLDGVIESLLAIGRLEIDPGVASADAVAIVRAALDACEPTADAFPRAIAPPGPRRGAGLGLPLARRPVLRRRRRRRAGAGRAGDPAAA